jgi:transcriptional regulator with XRE-family HTH domain
MSEEDELDQRLDDASPFGDWLRKEIAKRDISIQELADKAGLTYVGVWSIVKGHTRSPRDKTRAKLYAALDSEVPSEIETEVENQSNVSGYTWTDFSPYDLQTIPELGGVYVFYDITDRPVYVGKSRSNVRSRVQDHRSRFWFREPLVIRGSFLAIPERDMCDKIEMILIKFLGTHALLNQKGVQRDVQD